MLCRLRPSRIGPRPVAISASTGHSGGVTRPGSQVRTLRAILFVGGVALLAFLVVRVGASALVSILRRLEWWQLVLVCLPFGLGMAVDTLGWRYAFVGEPPPYPRMLAARTAGEALNLVTALGSVGGEAVKVWLLRPSVPYSESVPSVVIDKTTTAIAQALFLLLGVIVAVTVVPVDARIVTGMLVLLAVETLLVGGFLAFQLTGLVGQAGYLLAWCGLIADTSHAERLDANLRGFYRRRWRRFLLSTGCHLCGWILGVLEAFVMLSVLAIPAGVGIAAVIETLGSGVRFASFLVPGSLGGRARQAVWIGVGLVVLVAARVQARSAEGVLRRAAP